MDEKRIRELIDVCRPGSKDLADNEMRELHNVLNSNAGMRELYEQTQANDDAIRTAMHQIDVPANLANQLIERLAPDIDTVQGNMPSTRDSDVQVEVTCKPAADGVNLRRHWSRRRWLAISALACSAAVGGLILVPHLLTPRMHADELSGRALNWIDLLDDAWNDDLSTALERLPFSDRLSARPGAWQSWQTPPPLNVESIAYQLLSPFAHGKAVLFVAERANRIQALTTSPPNEPLANTGGRTSSAWQEDDRLYVLVVPGGKRQYQNCLRSQQFAAIY